MIVSPNMNNTKPTLNNFSTANGERAHAAKIVKELESKGELKQWEQKKLEKNKHRQERAAMLARIQPPRR